MGFYVRPSGKKRWIVSDVMTQRAISGNAYFTLGFDRSWPIKKARERAKQLNLQHRIQANAARRVEDQKLSIHAFLPDAENFEKKLLESSFGSDYHKGRLKSRWNHAMRIIRDLSLDVSQFEPNKEKFYQYFITKLISPFYSKAIIRIINDYGEYVCRSRNNRYEPIPLPRGRVLTRIEESYADSEMFRGESNPLTPELLNSVHTVLSLCNYNWLQVTVWFGLRPNEVDLKKIKVSKIDGVDVLSVYQSKLTSVSREKRWKLIPVLYPEQAKALLQLTECKRPLMKTLRRVFKQRITLYGGRKGFVDLMLDRGQTLEDISMWLGHQSIETTWRKYRNRKRVTWRKPA